MAGRPPRAVRIDYLADHAEGLVRVAGWLHEEWTLAMGLSAEQTQAVLRRRMNRDRVPLTLVAVAGVRLIGTASIIPSTRPDGSDTFCLAGVYVVPGWRRRGVGTLLCRRSVREACRLGLSTLCLYTRDHEAYYARRGWRTTAIFIDEAEGGSSAEAFMEPGSSLEALASRPGGDADAADSRELDPR